MACSRDRVRCIQPSVPITVGTATMLGSQRILSQDSLNADRVSARTSAMVDWMEEQEEFGEDSDKKRRACWRYCYGERRTPRM